MTILGIDPGLATTGWGVVKKNKAIYELVDYGCLITTTKEEHSNRLLAINIGLKKLIKKHMPDIIAVEELFFYKNVKTATKVGEARGVILLTAAELNIKIKEFTPLQVKQAITSYGWAEKKQMQKMVKALLNLKTIPKPNDAADALAVAITCLQTKY
jgi:crossover junction endodeoxyribonuclease RuvC